MNKVSVVVSKLLDLIGVQATKTTVIETLTNHPHYPSLLAVRDTLFSLKVLNVSYNLEPQHLKELPTPCIAHLREGFKEQFTIVKVINNNQVTRLEGNSQWVSEPITEFEKRWSGIAMLVEVQSSSGEVDYVKARLKEWLNIVRIPFLFLFLGFALIGIFLNHVHSSPPINWGFVLSIHILGMIVSLILMTEFFNGHKYIKKICGINSQLDCTSVLKSDQAKLWGVISWSELVFIYYTGSLLWLGFSHQYNSILSSLFYLSLLTLPFTLYSLYYQFFKQKKICLICILIVGLLWTDMFILYPHHNFPASLLSIYSGVLSFSIPIASWGLVKPWIENLQKTKKEIMSAKKLKTDPSFFTTVLHQQKKMPPLEDLNPLVLGDKTALYLTG